MLKLGLLFLLVRFLFLSVLPSKAVFIYIVRSLRFIPSPCFIFSPESAFYTQSAVRGPQSMFYTDRSANDVGVTDLQFLPEFSHW